MTTRKRTRVKPDSNSQGEVIIELGSTLGVADAKNLYRRLVSVRKKKRDVVLDASRLEAVDTAVLQLLTVFMRAMREDGPAVRWNDPSGRLRKTAALLDLEGYLGLNCSTNDEPGETLTPS